VRAVRDPAGVTLANWQEYPFNRWSFLHLGDLIEMAPIPRGPGPVWLLERRERDLLPVEFQVRGRTMTVREMLGETFTDGLIALHDGRIAFEWYAEGMGAETRHVTMSISKTLTSALPGVLVSRGVIDTGATAPDYVNELRGTSFDGCTIQHLLDMRAGTRWDEDYEHFLDSDAFVYEQVMGWRPGTSPGLPRDMFEYMANLRENDQPHGGPFRYRSILTDVLGWVLERAGGVPFAERFSTEIWSMVGAEQDAEITIDSGRCAITDGGICTTLRDLARFGQLYLEDGRGILPAGWVQRLGAPDPALVAAFVRAPEAGRYPGAMYHDCWWVLDPEGGVLAGLGIYGQMLLVHRSANSVVVKFSTQPSAVDLDMDEVQIRAAIAMCQALARGSEGTQA
jgi:CubicO group peptidase (beta-lactamase class C family)